MTFSKQFDKIEVTFAKQINKPILMKIELTNRPEMKILPLLKQLISNPWIGALASLAILIPSLYIILDDVTVLRKEYILLLIAFPIYLKSLKKIFDEILDSPDDSLK
ncbi:hypothetical protein [Flavobacterium sp. 245]|uniref:hypothetical protein n=1 Tax=Flavobacterium sp. 245 TaxID=2512115 RepID=UPI0010D49BBA|nr:hypothetical protein [Flavobacterium sp. 245]TDP03780.1 hypothetical protein EV145_101167 [Flavobacterium sp. 245]